jgi:DNA polymerase III subunit delta
MKRKSVENNVQDDSGRLFLLYGDEFLVKERLWELVNGFLPSEQQGANLVRMDGASLDLGELANQLSTSSLFSSRKVVIVEQTSAFPGRKDEKKILRKILQAAGSGDEKTAKRFLGQYLNVSGFTIEDVSDPAFLVETIGRESLQTDELRVLADFAKNCGSLEAKGFSAGDEEVLLDIISCGVPDDTILIFTSTGVDKQKKAFKTFLKHGRAIECSVLSDRQGSGIDGSFLNERVKAVLRKADKTISVQALDEIHTRSGKDLRRLHSELQKLVDYVGARKGIEREDIEAVFSDFHEPVFFELTNALRGGNPAKCISALHENLSAVSHPLQALAALASEFRKILAARDLLSTVFRKGWRAGMSYDAFLPVLKEVRGTASAGSPKGKLNILAMKDYSAYMYLSQAQRFSLQSLVGIMEAMLNADIALKSSKLGNQSPQYILEDLVLFICKLRETGLG